MRSLLDINLPALLIFFAGIVIAIKLDLAYFGLALILGPTMFFADIVNGDRASKRGAMQSLSVAIVLFLLGLIFSRMAGSTFVDFLNQYSIPVIRLVPLTALTLATYGLLQLAVASFTGRKEDDTNA